MHRFTILVDAGYLLRQAAEILSNKTRYTGRADITINDPQGLISMLVSKAQAALQNRNLLRVYWYDGVKTTLTAEHKALMALPDVQFRAGTVNGQGQQKGVDSRIVTDLVELAGHHAVCDAMLITGDGDLAIGVELAQRRGVRVAVLGIEDMTVGVHHSQSPEVVHVADRVVRIGRADIAPYIKYTPKPAPAKGNASVQANAPAQGNASVPAQPPTQARPPVQPNPPVLTNPPAQSSPPAQSNPPTKGNFPVQSNTSASAMAAALGKAGVVAAGASQPTQTAVPNTGSQKQVLDAATQKIVESAVDDYITNQNPPFTKAVVSSTGSIEQVADRGLLMEVASARGVKMLNNLEKNYARTVFRGRASTFA